MADELEARYDAIPYPTLPQPGTHPDQLAVNARLAGMKPRAPDRCRVLELGCGDGANLIGMALTVPESEFVGIDLAGEAIARGQADIAALGLTNVTLRKMDIRAAGKQLGQFDYVIAHGIYSWVPPEVRDALLAAVKASLAPDGVGYVSYNAMPGSHLRLMLREILLFHTSHVKDPVERVNEARGFIELLATVPSSFRVPSAYRDFLQETARQLADRTDADLFHDDLAPIFVPVSISAFTAHAARHGLQFLGEAEYWELSTDMLPPEIGAGLDELSKRDYVLKEQYVDFFRARQFRRTLLCHQEVALDRSVPPSTLAGFLFTCDALPQPGDGEGSVTFTSKARGSVTTTIPVAKAAVEAMGRAFPEAMSFAAVQAAAEQAFAARGEEWPGAFKAGQRLAEFLHSALRAGLVEAHLLPRHIVHEPAGCPIASPLARLQAARQDWVTTLRYDQARVEDPVGRHLLTLLDGTRDRSTLAAALVAAAPQLEGTDVLTELDAKLRELGRLGILVV